MLPPFFANIAPRQKTPYVALLFTAVIVLMVVTALPVEDVASCASMMFLFLFFLVNLCVIKIRRNMGDELDYGYLMPLFPLLPILAILAQALLAANIIHMSRVAWIVAPCWVAAGVAIYWAYSRRRAIATADEIQVFEERPAERVAPVGHNVMVAVANPKNALELVRNTYRVCGAKDARVELLHMVPVPDQVALSDAAQYMTEGKEAIAETMLYLGPMFPVSTTLRYCRNVARGIVSATREKDTDTLIMGWHGQARHRYHYTLGSTVDPIIERTPCNVVVLKDCGGNREYRRVLVPLAGGPNGAYALEVASMLAHPEEGEVVAFTVARKGSKFNLEDFVAEAQSRLHLPPERISTRSVLAGDVVEAILRESQEYDLVVIGASAEPLLYQVGRETLPQTVARRCEKPLVMTKASGGLQSWIKRWI